MGTLQYLVWTLLLAAVCVHLTDRFDGWLATQPQGLARLTFGCVIVLTLTLVVLGVGAFGQLSQFGGDSLRDVRESMTPLQVLLQVYASTVVYVLSAGATGWIIVVILIGHMLPRWWRARVATRAAGWLAMHEEIRQALEHGSDVTVMAEDYRVRLRQLNRILEPGRMKAAGIVTEFDPASGFRPYRDRLSRLDPGGLPPDLREAIASMQQRLPAA